MDAARSRLESDLEALRELPVFVAYNANVDGIVRVDQSLETYLDRPPGVPGEAVPPDRLASTLDLATAITRSMATGEGDEIAMTAEFAARLEAELVPDRTQMGGQAGIMTNLLSVLGAAPIVYTYLLSETQQSKFERPEAVRFPLVEDGRVLFVPLGSIVNTDRTKLNWIFEFDEGEELFGVRAAANTRFIAASRPPEFDLVAGDLDPVVDQVGAVIDGALLAGYHNLTREHVDEGYEAAHRHARDVVRRLRSGGEFPVHVEYAATHDRELRESLTELILPEADVVGLDTHELDLLRRDLGLEPAPPAELVAVDRELREDGVEDESILEQYRTLTAVRERLGVDCLRLHAMDYHLAVTDDYLPVEAVRRGLAFAAVNAASKAATGRITGPTDLRRGLEYDPSAAGGRAIDALADHVGASTDDGALCTPTIVACPNRVVEEPASTVGIGDIVSSSSFALEVAVTTERDGE
ncbi:ADP-dependent glucokinase/phosphofructokinase [Halorarum salinum]|uniref:Phosphofructokinase n=1 Tax=Halorarum salinum TaxID=2743089 RepID=A0A7D5LA20_9EURY|nr:ADP-dependent glucokinase/phosphofructokinase [Halobaculum salinum]QLG61866.1 phosphofructokinase [Halobaculum salinum]